MAGAAGPIPQVRKAQDLFDDVGIIDNGEEINRLEGFKASFELLIESGAVNDSVDWRLDRDLFDGKRVSVDLLAELFAFGAVFGRHRAVGIADDSTSNGILPSDILQRLAP